MKKVTAIVPDDADLSGLINIAVSLTLEKIGEEAVVKPARKAFRSRDGNTQTAIMDHYTPDGKFTRGLAEVWLKEKGFAETSASPALSALKKSGHIRVIASQKYIFVKPMEKTA